MRTLALLLIALFLACGYSLAEDVTITTYYPSPYGAYNELGSNKLSLGKNAAGSFAAPANEGSIRFNKPLSGNPSGSTGELAYFGSVDGFKYHNGSAWVSLSGGGGGTPKDWDCEVRAGDWVWYRTTDAQVYCRSAEYRLIYGVCHIDGPIENYRPGYPVMSGGVVGLSCMPGGNDRWHRAVIYCCK
jgi:hypothetical protein